MGDRFQDTFMETAHELDAADKTDELCCVFQRDWTRRLYGDRVVAQAPLSLWHLFKDSGDPWGPVTACVMAEIGERVSALVPGRWHRAQGWRGTPFADGVTGHTISVYAGKNDRVLVYDSAKDRNERVTSTTWSTYSAQYTGGVAIAVLREPLGGR
jgi:hypothetical protein